MLDATETDDQAPGPVNFLMNREVPGTALGLFFLGGDPGQVCNAGGPNALDAVHLREGSLLQPRFPAPLGMRGLTMMRVLAALNGLVNVAGGAAPAAHSAYVILLLRGTVDGQPFLMSDGVGVGYGARPDADGIDAVYFVAQENYPVEFLELGYPVRLRRYAIATDSGGPGRQRGGCGLVREYEILADHAVLAMRIDGVAQPALGRRRRQGRWAPAAPWSTPASPSRAPARPVVRRQRRCTAGDVLLLETGGGGGHGHPFDRPPGTVLGDVLDGFVSPAAAAVPVRRGHHGRRPVDAAATAARRADRPNAKRLPPPGVRRCSRLTPG